ncbi:MAG: response regulator [Candidatus Aureabacteria bacterium]|nr:response regulator [Candidatus Auribacterota bacterium]
MNEEKKPLTILLLEDEEDVRFMMSEMLEFMDYEVDIANNAEEAISLSKRKQYDYYLIDIVMEGKSGLDALREMPINDVKNSVVIVSANINTGNLEIAQSLGVTKILPKPIKINDLERMLKK